MIHRVPAARCPSCKRVLDGAFCPEHPDATPKAGDWSICAWCITVLKHDEHGDWQRVSDDEIKALSSVERSTLALMRLELGLLRALRGEG